MYLIADVGATKTRCALLDDKGGVLAPDIFHNADFTGLSGLLDVYLSHRRTSDQPRRAALAIAAPILGDQVRMTNIDWAFSRSELEQHLRLTHLTVVNDFAAIAWALPDLGPSELKQVGRGAPAPLTPLAVLGPGSGLGVATLVPSADSWAVASGEGGNVSVATITAKETAVAELIRTERGHCSAEDLLSGRGLVNIRAALSKLSGDATPAMSPEEIAAAAAQGNPLAEEARSLFFALLGTVAGNLALTVGARGGVFIAGGIIPQLLDAFVTSEFRDRFEAKGRYRAYMEAIPTYVVTEPLPAFRGLRKLLGYK